MRMLGLLIAAAVVGLHSDAWAGPSKAACSLLADGWAAKYQVAHGKPNDVERRLTGLTEVLARKANAFFGNLSEEDKSGLAKFSKDPKKASPADRAKYLGLLLEWKLRQDNAECGAAPDGLEKDIAQSAPGYHDWRTYREVPPQKDDLAAVEAFLSHPSVSCLAPPAGSTADLKNPLLYLYEKGVSWSWDPKMGLTLHASDVSVERRLGRVSVRFDLSSAGDARADHTAESLLALPSTISSPPTEKYELARVLKTAGCPPKAYDEWAVANGRMKPVVAGETASSEKPAVDKKPGQAAGSDAR